jgi:hypothetical protein
MPGAAHGIPTVPRRLVFAVAIGLTVLAGAVMFARIESAGEPRIEHLSDEQRIALYHRTLADLELCSSGAGEALANHCAHQAKLISQFAECDAHCRKLAGTWQKLPSR